MKNRKTYVLTVSQYFMKSHPRAGEPTGFFQKIISGEKKHTIRENYELWKKRADEINDGKAILSVRQWSGTPYRTPQQEILQLQKVGVQRIMLWQEGDYNVEGKYVGADRSELAKNDGLSEDDFYHWFKGSADFEGVIIHFTDFRYSG